MSLSQIALPGLIGSLLCPASFSSFNHFPGVCLGAPKQESGQSTTLGILYDMDELLKGIPGSVTVDKAEAGTYTTTTIAQSGAVMKVKATFNDTPRNFLSRFSSLRGCNTYEVKEEKAAGMPAVLVMSR